MITYSNLGKNGRLGNQLWQIASTIGIAAARSEEFSFPVWQYADRFLMPSEWFLGSSGVESETLADRLPEAARPYLQDVSYIQPIEDTLRDTFRLRDDRFIDSISIWLNIDHCAGVHVRRGDYAEEWRGHGLLDRQWYLDHWPSGKVIIFSDDPEWCKDNLPGEVHHFGEIDDFHLMTRCRELLISNSSYSWWSGWIGGQPVTYPDPWFTGAPVGDIHWPGWTKAPR